MKLTHNGFGHALRSISATDTMASESAVAPIKLKYMGHVPIDLDGNDEWDAALDHGDAYELIPAANARGKVAIALRIERKREIFYLANRENLLRLLAGSKFPKKMDLSNLIYATGKGMTKGHGLVEIGSIKKDVNDVSTHKWYLSAGVAMFIDSNKKHYLAFDMRTALEDFMPKTKIARLKATFRKGGADSEIQTVNDKKQEAKVKLATEQGPDSDKRSVPVTSPTVGAGSAVIPPKTVADTSYGFLAVTPHEQHASDSWVVYAPTRGALNTKLETLANAAGSSMAKAGKVEMYKIVKQSPLIQQLGNRVVTMATADIKAKATFVRMLSYSSPVDDGAVQHERPWTDINPQDINVSWSAFDPAETRLAISRLFNEGFFSASMRPRPTTKGLVFDIPTGSHGRDDVHGAARRVYQWLHNIGIPEVKIVMKWAPTKALVDFRFPDLSNEAKESIRLLREKPPVLGSPIYTIEGQTHRTFQIYDTDVNSGKVFMYPVRNAQPLTTSPTSVMYTKVRRLTAK